MKDWCSYFPEYIFGQYIGDACRGHDGDCSTSRFYKNLVEDLKELTFNHELAFIIAVGGGAGCWWFHTKLMKRRWQD